MIAPVEHAVQHHIDCMCAVEREYDIFRLPQAKHRRGPLPTSVNPIGSAHRHGMPGSAGIGSKFHKRSRHSLPYHPGLRIGGCGIVKINHDCEPPPSSPVSRTWPFWRIERASEASPLAK